GTCGGTASCHRAAGPPRRAIDPRLEVSSHIPPLPRRSILRLFRPSLEAEAGKEQVNLSFELGPVAAKQCRANQSLQTGGDDLGHTLSIKFGWQFTGVFGGIQSVRQRADKGRNIRLNELF